MAELANSDVNTTVEVGSTTTESSPAETNNLSADTTNSTELDFSKVLDEEPANEDNSATVNPESSDGESDASEGEQDNRPAKGAEQRKQQLNTEIRNLVAEKNALERSVAELNRQKYQIASKDDLPTVEQIMEQVNEETGEYFTRTEAQLLLLQAQIELGEQERELDAYNKQIVDNTMALKEEVGQTLKEFPMFDSSSDQYDENLAVAADKILDASLIRDSQTGRVIGCRISPYELYSTIANAALAGKTQGEVASRKATQKMMQNVDVPNSASTASTGNKDETSAFLDGLHE